MLKTPIILVCVGDYASVARQRMPVLPAHSASGSERNEYGECHIPMADRIGSMVRGGELPLAIDVSALESPGTFSSNPHLCGLL